MLHKIKINFGHYFFGLVYMYNNIYCKNYLILLLFNLAFSLKDCAHLMYDLKFWRLFNLAVFCNMTKWHANIYSFTVYIDTLIIQVQHSSHMNLITVPTDPSSTFILDLTRTKFSDCTHIKRNFCDYDFI